MSKRIFMILLAALLVSSLPAAAQEARGTILGRVTDPGGGVIPGASVVAVNKATNETRRTVTNDTGYFELNFLEPGTYTVTVEAKGFKKLLRSNIEVSTGSRVDLPFAMEIGQVAETIEVTAEAPLLDTSTATAGRVLDNKQIQNLPFSDTNPFALSALAPGMQWTGQPEYRRPFDNGGTSAFNTMGGVGQNEYTMDGMTVTGTGRRVGFTPPQDSVSEFKLETASFDASQGFTSGASINVTGRGGTNQLHGSVSDQFWNQRWNATQHFTRLAWQDAVAAGKISPSTQKQASGKSNNYSASAYGPVFIPKVFDGRNKLFWGITWNGIKQTKAETTDAVNVTVPTSAMKQGDFSQFLTVPSGVSLYTIYDPRTARKEGSNVVRTPFPENKGVPILNPMYKNYVGFYPAPNNVPGLVTADNKLNYLATAMPKNENFNAIVNRYDYIINDKHRIMGRWLWNNRLANEYDWTYTTALGLMANGLTRINQGGGGSWLWTINTNNILDVGVGIARFKEGNVNNIVTSYTPSQVGLPAYMDTRAGDNHILPRAEFDTIADVSGSYPAIGNINTVWDTRATMTTIKGSHSFKYGYQGRIGHFAQSGPGYSSGSFTFRNMFTKATDTDNRAANHAHDWAEFMMGAPQSLFLDSNDSFYFYTPRNAAFFQDDWRINSKLRIQMGLRWEQEGGISESLNRGISGVFDFTIKQPFTDLSKAAYASAPVPELPASQFNPVGGTAYLGTLGYKTFTKGTQIFLPKLGVVYSANSKTVIRAGWGMFMDTLNVANTRPNTTGYNLPTSTPITNDAGFSLCCGVGDASNLSASNNVLTNPFPVRASGTRFDNPLQNALGPLAQVNRGFGAYPWNYRPALQNRWRIGIQREIRRNLMVDVSYNGAYSWQGIQQRVDALPQQYWATGNTRNQAVDNNMNANVPNPYNIKYMEPLKTTNPTLYNYMAGQSFFTSSVIAKNVLLRPQGFMAASASSGLNGVRDGVDWKDVQGYVTYNDMQVLVEQRFTNGFQTSLMYTYGSSYVADYYYNQFDTKPSERINNNVVPHRLAWTGTYDLPWGKGRKFVNNGFMSYVIGNWNLGWVYQRQSGPATDWGNVFYYGDPNYLGAVAAHNTVNSQNIHMWFDPALSYRGPDAYPAANCNCFEGRNAGQPGTYQVRMFPYRSDQIRSDGIRNWDLKVERTFPILPDRGMQARFSMDLLNLTNHTNFNAPVVNPVDVNFGRVTAQRGLSRVIQFNLRFDF